MSPLWPRILAARTSLMPRISVSELPEAATACWQRRRFATRARSMRRTSMMSWRAIAWRSWSMALAGRIEGRSWAGRSPRGGGIRGERAGGAAGMQVAQGAVQAVDGAAALAGQLVAAIGQQP